MAIVFKTPISTLNTTTKDIQNIKQGDCPPCPEPVVESTSEEYTSNGEYTLTPKEGVDGFSQVEITVNVPSDVNNQNKDVTISQNGEQTISADSGYTGLGEVSVTVAVDVETPYNEGYAAGEEAGIATGKAEGIAEQKAKLTSTTITENGTTTREDGWNSVTVNVDVTTPYNNGVAAGEAAQKAKLTSGTFVSNGTYTREDGYNEVTVNVPSDVNNQDKTVNPSTSQQTVSADNGYSGLGQVTVNAVTASIDRNIQPENIVDGVTILGVTGDVFVPTLEEETYAPEFIGTTTVEPRIKGNGFSSVEITVPTDPVGSANNPFINIQTVLDTDFGEGCYDDEITSGEINETTGYYDAVANDGTVFHIKPYWDNPDYDPELRPEDQPDVPEYIFPEDFDLAGKNIIVWFNKANVSQINNQTKAPLLRSAIIYEFNDCTLAAINYNFEQSSWPFGTLDVTENGTVDPTGYAEIDVNVQPTLQTKSVTPSDRQQVITPDRDYDGLSEVTVSGVTAAIDQNITASNIKDGVTILGVTGTYDPQPSLESQTASYTANGTYTITPSTGYDGMSDVEVTVNVSGGSGTQCPDWSSIGWDCNDVAVSGIAANVAYTAQKKEAFEGGTISSFANDTTLRLIPRITLPSNSSGLFSGCTYSNIDVPTSFNGQPTNINNLFFRVNLRHQPSFDWSEVTTAEYTFANTTYSQGIYFNPVVNAPKCTSMLYCFGSGNGSNKSMTTATVNAPLVTNANNMFAYNKNLATVNLTLGEVTNIQGMFSNCSSLTAVPAIDTSKCKDFREVLLNCSSITTFPNWNYTGFGVSDDGLGSNNLNSGPFAGTGITSIPDITIGNGTVSNTNKNVAFGGMTNLTTIGNITLNFGIGGITFRGDTNLTTIGSLTNFGGAFGGVWNTSNADILLQDSTALTKQSIMNIINTVGDRSGTTVAGTIQLSAASYALLDASDIAIATAKNWAITSA